MAYATTDDFADFIAPTSLPANATRLLERASDVVDEILIGAVYATDDSGNPVDSAVIAAFKKATLYQAFFAMEVGDETGANDRFQSATQGGVSYTLNTNKAPQTLRQSADAINVLRLAGLLPVTPYVGRIPTFAEYFYWTAE